LGVLRITHGRFLSFILVGGLFQWLWGQLSKQDFQLVVIRQGIRSAACGRRNISPHHLVFLVSARHISTVTLAASNSAKAGGGIGYYESRGEEKNTQRTSRYDEI